MDEIVRNTISICGDCQQKVTAQVLFREDRLWFRTQCQNCGDRERIFPEDGVFYKKIIGAVKAGNASSIQPVYPHGAPLPPIRGVILDLTGRCNLYCPHCFARANDVLPPEPDIATLKRWFKTLAGVCQKSRPVVFIQGGEPTLREDLGEVVSLLHGLGFRMKLVTNGLRLADPSYARRLKRAGLEWVFLQYDGDSSEATSILRGKDILAEKKTALQNLVECRFKILLACMVKKEVNLDQIGSVMELAIRTEQVQQVSFLPESGMGRDDGQADRLFTSAHDVVEELARWSNGQLTGEDFIAFLSVSRKLWRWTKNPDFQPKTCFLPMVLALDGERMVPLNRMFGVPRSFSELRCLARSGSLIRNLSNIDDMPYNRHLLTLVIEHFRHPAVFDLEDANHCNKYYITERGLSPSCVYNAYERGLQECSEKVPVP